MNKICLSLVILLWISSISVAQLQKLEVIDAVKRNALCNDGSPAVYYFQPGWGDGSRRWVILLEGGGFCNNYHYTGRHPYYMSSLDTPESLEVSEGLLSSSLAENPDFYTANKVMIHYCSSDLWSGNRLEDRGFRPLQFRGRTILRAVIKDLLRRTDFFLSEAGTEVLFAGWSAGGVGVLVNLDWLSKRLPHAKVSGLNDAGWWPVESKSGQDLDRAVAQGIPIWGAKADQDCAIANRKNKSKCYLSTAFPYINTPLFIQQSQRDPAYAGAHPVAFAKAVRDSLDPVVAAFSRRTNTHEGSTSETFVSVKINGYSFAQLLGNWFFDRPGPVKMIKK